MKVTLDATALRVLLDANPEFELEVQKAVIHQIAKTWTFKVVENMIRNEQAKIEAIAQEATEAALKEHFSSGTYTWSEGSLRPDAVKKIEREARAAVNDEFVNCYQSAVDDAVEELKASDDMQDEKFKKDVQDYIVAQYDRDLEKTFGQPFRKRWASLA